MLRIGYADQNGHPYRRSADTSSNSGELTLGRGLACRAIQAWARANPARLGELLNQNPSYVFFRELPPADTGPLGALGVPLTAGALDRRGPALRPARRAGLSRHDASGLATGRSSG